MTHESVLKIQRELPENSALLVSSVPNRFYLSGFESSDGYVLITEKKAYFLIDFRYFEKAKQTVSSCEVILANAPMKQIDELCRQNGIMKVYIESERMPLGAYKRLCGNISPEVSNSDKFDRLIADERAVKTNKEIALIKQAQAMTDETFSYILGRIEKGRSERDIMLDMEFYMRRLGSEGVSFDFIVVSGKNSSLPHGVPTEKPLQDGDFITMDFGAVVGGYRSDMTRTVALGNVSDEQRAVYDTVLKAQTESIKAVKSGKKCCDIDKAARDIIYNSGYKGCFGHALGHSVGIEIHESPTFSPSCSAVLCPGMVITVEPGIYIENKFGVRIEDMIVVTDNGCEDITKSDRSLICL